MDSTNNLKELYEDKDGLRKEEVAALSGPNEFAEFYTRLKGIKDFYRRLPNEVRNGHCVIDRGTCSRTYTVVLT
jgi:splicing factor 3A subunit 3